MSPGSNDQVGKAKLRCAWGGAPCEGLSENGAVSFRGRGISSGPRKDPVFVVAGNSVVGDDG